MRRWPEPFTRFGQLFPDLVQAGHALHLSVSAPAEAPHPPPLSPSLPYSPATEVWPGLYLGDARAGADAALHRSLGIGTVINAARECASPTLGGDRPPRYLHLRLRDSPDERVGADAVEAACALLDTALREGDHALVYCRAGRSRSATVVLAFLITRRGVPLTDAYARLQARRPSVSPNLGYMGFLLQLPLGPTPPP
jgi:predicted protein tyrosine phosphatase